MDGETRKHRSLSGPTALGLALTLGFPVYVTFLNHWLASRFADGPPRLIHDIGAQVVWNWLLVGVVIVVAYRLERTNASSIGWKGVRRADVVWAFALWIPTMIVIIILQGADGGEHEEVRDIFQLPWAFRLLLLLTVAITEEVIYRGYPLERLTSLLGRPWVAAVITFAIFTVGHVPYLGWRTVLLTTAPGALVLTVLYVRRRSLGAAIILHALLDAFLLLPSGPSS